jgi:hypothetical protein
VYDFAHGAHFNRLRGAPAQTLGGDRFAIEAPDDRQVVFGFPQRARDSSGAGLD